MTKIDLSCYKERQMKRRIDALIVKAGIATYDEYVAALRKDPALLEEFVTYLTINVSEFYRNPDQWKILENEVFPKLIQKFGKNLKIWSAACSTGDEPYSLVMALSAMLSVVTGNLPLTSSMLACSVVSVALRALASVSILACRVVSAALRAVSSASMLVCSVVSAAMRSAISCAMVASFALASFTNAISAGRIGC